MTNYTAHNLKEFHEAILKSSKGDMIIFYEDSSDGARIEAEAFKKVIDEYNQEAAKAMPMECTRKTVPEHRDSATKSLARKSLKAKLRHLMSLADHNINNKYY
jgi:hypothetical protein